MRVSDFGRDALGLSTARFLTRVVPPHTAVILVVELTVDEELIDPVENVEEQLGKFQGMEPLLEDVQQSSVDDSRIGARRVFYTYT